MTTIFFIVTSVIDGALYSVIDRDTRVHQTLETIGSIKRYAPGAKILIVEGSGYKWDHIEDVYVEYCNVIGFNKNVGEATLTQHGLRVVNAQHPDTTRIFKISGRYVLNHEFDMQQHTGEQQTNKIVVRRDRVPPPCLFCTVTVLYSFPTKLKDYVYERLEHVRTGHTTYDIEHEIFGYMTLDPDMFHVMPRLGVQGHVAPSYQAWSA